MRVPNLRGMIFGRLTVLRQVGAVPRGSRLWECRCCCGALTVAQSSSLRAGLTRSCGCLRRELVAARSTTHGCARQGSHHPLYTTWLNMRKRCRNPRHPDYRLYGGRGITICRRWDDFALFLADMGDRPSRQHSLDRIDNDGNYDPGNCRWATPKEQTHNRRPRRMSALRVDAKPRML